MIYFFFPELSSKYFCGGYHMEYSWYLMLSKIYSCQIIEYKSPKFKLDKFKNINPKKNLIILFWGPDIGELAKKLYGYHIVVHSHSVNYNYSLSKSLIILCVSKSTFQYWYNKGHRVYYLNNFVNPVIFKLPNTKKDIDVLVQKRKNSTYVINKLIPRLKKKLRVKYITNHIENINNLYLLMKRSKIYIYDSEDFWSKHGLTEGFGLPPLEAIACDCLVFSSLNDGLSDYLEPGINCYQLTRKIKEDTKKIISKSINFSALNISIDKYKYKPILKKLKIIMKNIIDDYQLDLQTI